jgi:signal transduction histidine kinase|tara:strand:+ start:260 stop:730 length:471 start_codon:yes stop_codon:yes gene_type:complete
MVVHTVVHDTNNLLGVIRSGLSMLKDPAVEIDPTSLCNRMGTAVDRVEDMHRQLMRRERELHDREATLDIFPLEEALNELRSYARLHPRLKDCDLHFGGGESLNLRANRTEFAQAILNLILNAADATNNEGRISVEALQMGSQIRLEVDDDGPGIT